MNNSGIKKTNNKDDDFVLHIQDLMVMGERKSKVDLVPIMSNHSPKTKKQRNTRFKNLFLGLVIRHR